jgi:HNH endonuclease
MATLRRVPIEKRFWSKVEIRGPDECWPWLRGLHEFGYGKIGVTCENGRNRTRVAHQVAWELAVGPIPPGKKVLHNCDNAACCNPRHLKIGTQRENIADMVAKGRSAGRPRVLGIEAILEIRASRALQRELAERFGVSQITIGRVRRGIGYGEV